MAEQQQQQHSEIPNFGLPDPLLAVLPKDPFEQLNIARKITSIALASRVSSLEAEASRLRLSLASKDDAIADLTSQLDNLDASLDDLSGKLARAEEEKERLVSENADLSNTVKKLNRDVSKLEVFKKALMQSLQEEDGSHVGAPRAVSRQSKNDINFTTEALGGEEDPTATSNSYSAQSQFPETGSSEDGAYGELETSRQSLLPTLSLGSLSSTPKLTPPGSPPRHATGGTPKRLSKPVSPRRSRHSISFPSTRNMFEERPSVYSSMPSVHSSSMSSPFDTGAQTGRARVDGKEFFRQVRSRLSYEQFSAFLANVKELNAHKQTKEETLRRADEIFGPNNKDLYAIFESLISRNPH